MHLFIYYNYTNIFYLISYLSNSCIVRWTAIQDQPHYTKWTNKTRSLKQIHTALLSEEMSPKHCYQLLKKYFFRTDKIVRTSQQIT